jgi:hypothetical protein
MSDEEMYYPEILAPIKLENAKTKALEHLSKLLQEAKASYYKLNDETAFLDYLMQQVQKIVPEEPEGSLSDQQLLQQQAFKALAFLQLLTAHTGWKKLCHLYVPVRLLMYVDAMNYQRQINEMRGGGPEPKPLLSNELPRNLTQVLLLLAQMHLSMNPVQPPSSGKSSTEITSRTVNLSELGNIISRQERLLEDLGPVALGSSPLDRQRRLLNEGNQGLKEMQRNAMGGQAGKGEGRIPASFLRKQKIFTLYRVAPQHKNARAVYFTTLDEANQWLEAYRGRYLATGEVDEVLSMLRTLVCDQCSRTRSNFVQTFRVIRPQGQLPTADKSESPVIALAVVAATIDPLDATLPIEIERDLQQQAHQLLGDSATVKYLPFNCTTSLPSTSNLLTCTHGYLWFIQGFQSQIIPQQSESALLKVASSRIC